MTKIFVKTYLMYIYIYSWRLTSNSVRQSNMQHFTRYAINHLHRIIWGLEIDYTFKEFHHGILITHGLFIALIIDA